MTSQFSREEKTIIAIIVVALVMFFALGVGSLRIEERKVELQEKLLQEVCS